MSLSVLALHAHIPFEAHSESSITPGSGSLTHTSRVRNWPYHANQMSGRAPLSVGFGMWGPSQTLKSQTTNCGFMWQGGQRATREQTLDRLRRRQRCRSLGHGRGNPTLGVQHRRRGHLGGRIGGNQACLEKDVHPRVGSTDPIPVSVYVTLTCTLNMKLDIMDLAGGTYSSVHVLVSACLTPSDRMRKMQWELAAGPRSHPRPRTSGIWPGAASYLQSPY